MKLYYSPGACSLHPHITLREAGVPFELVRVDLRSHKVSDGSDYYAVNAKGYVPALRLDDGSLLTEGAVIDQYVADLKPEKNLIPAAGTMARYRVQEWLNFIASEIHKSFGPLFGSDEAAKEGPRKRLNGRFELVDKTLASQPYLAGDRLHRGRCVSLQHAALDHAYGHQPGQVAGHQGVRHPRRVTPRCSGGARRREELGRVNHTAQPPEGRLVLRLRKGA